LIDVGDMLGGHVDDMEADWTKPIVSIRYDGPASYLFHDFIVSYQLPFILLVWAANASFFWEERQEMKFQQQCSCAAVI
jgi:hypothetical protein